MLQPLPVHKLNVVSNREHHFMASDPHQKQHGLKVFTRNLS